MTTFIRPPEAEEWAGGTATSSGTIHTITPATPGAAIFLPIDFLRPGIQHTITATITATPAPGRTVTYACDYTLATMSADTPTPVEISTTAMRPVVLTMTGAATVTVADLTITAPDELPAAPVPVQVISLELATIPPWVNVFRLGISRLGNASLTTAKVWPGTFVIGDSRLGRGILGHTAAGQTWWAQTLPEARLVEINRPTDTQTPAIIGLVGTLVAEWPNALDPRAWSLRKGTPVRAYHWPSRRPLFVGAVDDARVEPVKEGGHVTTIEATNRVAELVATQRWGIVAAAAHNDQVPDRVARLLDPHSIPWREAGPGSNGPGWRFQLGRSVYEGPLVTWLDMTLASVAGAWWVDAHNEILICHGLPTAAPQLTFTDHAAGTTGPWLMIDAQAGWDTAALITVVELTNHGAYFDPDDGAWRADDITYPPVENITNAATWGRRLARIDTTLHHADDVATLATEMVNSVEPRTVATSATVIALDTRRPDLADHARAAELDLFTPVATSFRGESATAWITGLHHRLTPTRWEITATLTERNAA